LPSTPPPTAWDPYELHVREAAATAATAGNYSQFSFPQLLPESGLVAVQRAPCLEGGRRIPLAPLPVVPLEELEPGDSVSAQSSSLPVLNSPFSYDEASFDLAATPAIASGAPPSEFATDDPRCSAVITGDFKTSSGVVFSWELSQYEEHESGGSHSATTSSTVYEDENEDKENVMPNV
jgi:hypothetical protein